MGNKIRIRLKNWLRGVLVGKCGRYNEANRNEWLRQTLSRIPKNKRILDAGAGELKYKSYCEHLEYVSQDFAQYDGVGDGAGLQEGRWDQTKLDIVCDITNIPQPDASFDAIVCVEVFEHLPDPVSALREFARLLRDDGTLVLTAPFASLTHFAPYHFSSGFNQYFYEKCLPELGFEKVEITFNGNYFEYLAQELRRVPLVAKRYCSSSFGNKIRGLVNVFPRLLILNWLAKLSADDRGSHELLSYGLHVQAIRQAR